MPLLKLKVKKAGLKNPVTKQMGYVARVLTNGTARVEDIVREAGHNTTMHKAEVRMALELCLEASADMLKQGYIVELGPIGRLYPSCSSGWVEKEEDLSLNDVKPSVYYRAGDDVEAAVRSAKLQWVKKEDEEDEDDDETPTPDPTPGPDDQGGGGGGADGDDEN